MDQIILKIDSENEKIFLGANDYAREQSPQPPCYGSDLHCLSFGIIFVSGPIDLHFFRVQTMYVLEFSVMTIVALRKGYLKAEYLYKNVG